MSTIKFIGFDISSGVYDPPDAPDLHLPYSNFNLRFLTDQLLNGSGKDVVVQKVKTLYLLNFFGIYKGDSMPKDQRDWGVLEDELAQKLNAFLEKDVRLIYAAVKAPNRTKTFDFVGFAEVK